METTIVAPVSSQHSEAFSKLYNEGTPLAKLALEALLALSVIDVDFIPSTYPELLYCGANVHCQSSIVMVGHGTNVRSFIVRHTKSNTGDR